MTPTLPFTNISCYLFATLTNLKERREEMLAFCKARQLKGTILISLEGINLFIAGPPENVAELVAYLRAIPGLEKLAPKHSPSDHQPFSRMLVRIKKEIIAFGVEGINPALYTSPSLPAKTLKQWFDEGRDIVLYDTRNDYEIKLGTFKGAIPAKVDKFRDFPAAVAALPEEMKNKTVVTFCTGGIRCEKAAPFMEKMGFTDIYQLDGGILKYFEEVGGDYYDGECFVFDQRVGVDPALRETNSAICFVCQTPLNPEEQADPRYEADVSCPYCYEEDQKLLAARLVKRAEKLANLLSDGLPGSKPYDNFCPLRIPVRCDGLTLHAALCTLFEHVEPEFWTNLIAQGKILLPKGDAAKADRIVRAGESFMRLMPGTQEPDVNAAIRFVYEDEAVLLVEKPAPLPMHPCGRFNRNSLQWLLSEVCYPVKPRPIHRLDANTTGLVLFGKSRRHTSAIQKHFHSQGIQKTYLAQIQGNPEQEEWICRAPISQEAGTAGTRETDEEHGLDAETHFRVLDRHADGTTLLEVKPLTGRTNQIRVHLWQQGFPIIGDTAYLPDQQKSGQQTQQMHDSPLCLHAWQLAFPHPVQGELVHFATKIPAWAKKFEKFTLQKNPVC